MPPYHWWRTVFFLIPAIAVYTTVLGTISLGSSFFDRSGRFAHKCARAWSWLILKTTGVTVDVRGLERLPRDTSYVFAANHQSIYDIPVLFWHLPFELRILAKASLGVVPVPRLAPGPHRPRARRSQEPGRRPVPAGAPADAGRLLADRLPGGHPQPATAALARFRAGTFMMAIESGLPVVPVAVDGSRFVMRKGQLMTCPGHVRVTVLDPIPTVGQRARGGARLRAPGPGRRSPARCGRDPEPTAEAVSA